MLLRRLCLLAVLAAGALFVVVSFDPRVRMADPNPDQELDAYRDYHCYFDRVYTPNASSDVFVFGASRTFFAARSAYIERAYQAVRDENVSVAVFAPRWPNAEIGYLFLRDYLEHNLPPRRALIELTTNVVRAEPVGYLHPLFANLASPDMYGDVFSSWDFIPSRLFAASDVLQLLIRHIDLSLNNLLVREHSFRVPAGDNCAAGRSEHIPVAESANDFAALLEREANAILPAGGWEVVGDFDRLTELYKSAPIAGLRLQQFGPDWSRKATEEPWAGGAIRAKSVDYYQRIVALAAEHDMEIGFYVLPQLYAPMPQPDVLSELSAELGAKVHAMPYRYSLLSYHHYRDSTHVTDAVGGLYGAWFASLIDAQGDD